MANQDYIPENIEPKGFFKPSGFHVGATLLVVVLSIFAFLPMSFETNVGHTALVNYVLIAIMLVSLLVLVIDLFVKQGNGE